MAERLTAAIVSVTARIFFDDNMAYIAYIPLQCVRLLAIQNGWPTLPTYDRPGRMLWAIPT